MRKKQKFYYLFETVKAVPSYMRVMYADNAKDAIKMFVTEYHGKFGIYPSNFHHRRVDKATYEIINGGMEKYSNEFKVLITEQLQKVVTITADNAKQAKEIATMMYNNEEIVLSANDLYDHTIETLP